VEDRKQVIYKNKNKKSGAWQTPLYTPYVVG